MTDQDKKLTEQQEQAIRLIVLGRTDEQVGKAVGVARQTISKWKNQHPHFKAELNKERVDMWESHQDQIRSLIGEAVDVLRQNLANIDDDKIAQDAALIILKGTGCLYSDKAYDVYRPTGSTDPDEIIRSEKERSEIRAIFNRTG